MTMEELEGVISGLEPDTVVEALSGDLLAKYSLLEQRINDLNLSPKEPDKNDYFDSI